VAAKSRQQQIGEVQWRDLQRTVTGFGIIRA
jgi:hypothetical protein